MAEQWQLVGNEPTELNPSVSQMGIENPSAATLGFLMFVVKSHELLHFSLPIGIIAYAKFKYNIQKLDIGQFFWISPILF